MHGAREVAIVVVIAGNIINKYSLLSIKIDLYVPVTIVAFCSGAIYRLRALEHLVLCFSYISNHTKVRSHTIEHVNIASFI